MIQLRIVKSASNEEDQEDYEDSIPHGTQVLKEILLSWSNTDRVFRLDSHFSSVPAAEELCKHGLRFIGVIKTATRKFPMVYLSNLEL